jgi:hypothetical protein
VHKCEKKGKSPRHAPVETQHDGVNHAGACFEQLKALDIRSLCINVRRKESRQDAHQLRPSTMALTMMVHALNSSKP